MISATTFAVTGASPVTMMVRTPRLVSSVISAAESSRGGSLSAITPVICSFAAAPDATARIRYPLACNSSTMVEQAGDGCDSPWIGDDLLTSFDEDRTFAVL